jgi:hypothetical protein
MSIIHSVFESLIYISFLPLLGAIIYAVAKDKTRSLFIASAVSLVMNILVQLTR